MDLSKHRFSVERSDGVDGVDARLPAVDGGGGGVVEGLRWNRFYYHRWTVTMNSTVVGDAFAAVAVADSANYDRPLAYKSVRSADYVSILEFSVVRCVIDAVAQPIDICY